MKKRCEICGRETNRTHSLRGYKCVCSKHMHQIFKYGHPLDTIARTNNDLNDYTIIGEEVYFNLYNQQNLKIGEFIIDLDDIEKVKYHKWRVSHKHVVTGVPAQHNQRDLSWIILNLAPEEIAVNHLVIDHIDGNGFNNKKSNLRICTQSQNVLNKSFMSNNILGFIGVSFRKDRERYDPEIRLNSIRCHLGYTKTLEEAVYKRYYAEQLLFKDFTNQDEHKRKEIFTQGLKEATKKELESIVLDKLKKKKLWL